MFGRGKQADGQRAAATTSSMAREPWTVKVAVFSARHRWPVLAFWFVLMIGLFVGSALLGGQKAQSIMEQGDPIGDSGAGWQAWDRAKGTGPTVDTQTYDLVIEKRSGQITDASGQAAVAEITKRLLGQKATVDGREVDVFWKDPASQLPAVTDPLALATAQPSLAPRLISADKTSVLIEAKIEGARSVVEAKVKPLPGLVAELRSAYPDFELLALNNQLINDDFGKYVNSSLDGLLFITLPLTFLILLIAFRAVVAAFVPLVLAVSTLMGAMGIVGIYSQVVTPVSSYANQIVVLIGLAVAVDYSLFIITRFRTERARGKSKIGSIEVASSTAGRAVFFSGLAVMISLSGLFLIRDNTFQSIAVGAIAVVLVSVVASLLFLPAILSILDRKVDRLRIPFLPKQTVEGRGVWAAIVRAATSKAAIACIGTAVVLLLVAAPTAALKLGSTTNDISALPDSVEGVRAYRLVESKWPQGTQLTLEVMVTNATSSEATAAIGKLQERALAVSGVGGPAKIHTSGDGTAKDVVFTLAGSLNDSRNWDIVRTMRSEIVPQTVGSVPDSKAYVTGMAAYALDYGSWYGGQMPMVLAFVLGFSFLLLLVAFHSIVIPIKAILLNLLSAGGAFGVLVLLFQEGWLRDITGIKPSVVEAWAPLMIFTILFGLSMDYEVFILTRVKEARDRGLSSVDAVVKGITITSGTVTSAAAIMVCVFMAFYTIKLAVIQQLGVGMAVAILIDATLVRSLLLPSTMKLLGEWNWWMPPFLRWLPRITIEGEPEEVLDDGASAEAAAGEAGRGRLPEPA